MRHLLFRVLAGLARHVGRALARAAVTGLVFAVGLWAAHRYAGVPLPDASDLLDKIESVSQLSKILS